jgi:putative glutamine amidotransferase
VSVALPRILVTASRADAVEEYLDAVREAGGDPVRVEPGTAMRDRAGDAAGILFTGGVDVDPASYGARFSALIERTEPERDAMEIDMLRSARERGVPTLCICRGLQMANVAFGGTLMADVPHHLGGAATIRHSVRNPDGRTERGLIPEHVVAIDEDGLLRRIIGADHFVTGARHHQAVERCAGDLRVVARTADDIIEALEARFDSPFWLAVQWHPESTRDLDAGTSRAIFSAFVQAAVTRCVRPGGVSGGAIGGAPR